MTTTSSPTLARGARPGLSSKDAERFTTLGLYYNSFPDEPAVLCRRCGFVLKPDSDPVSRHLGEKHGWPRISVTA